MAQLEIELREFPCHFIWKLEQKSIKQFRSLMDSINDYINECPAMKIESLLFKCYIFYSDFKGNIDKNKTDAITCINEVRRILQDDLSEQPFKDGYLAIALAIEAWLNRHNRTKLASNITELRRLDSKYEIDSSERNKFTASICSTKGFALSRVGMIRYPDSIKELKKAVDLCPEVVDWQFCLGKMIWRIGKASSRRHVTNKDILEADRIFHKVVSEDRNNSYALAIMGEIKRRRGAIEDAETLLKRALGDPMQTNTKVLGEVAQCYRRMKKHSKSLEVLHVAVKRKPTSFIFHQLHCVYRDMRQQQPPEDYLQKAIDMNPSNMGAQCDRAKQFFSRNEYDKGRAYYEWILDNNQNDPEITIETTYMYGMSLGNIQHFEDSVEKFVMVVDKALELKLDDDPPLFPHEIKWMVDVAAERVRTFYKRNLNEKESLLKLAELEIKLGNSKEACEHYRHLLIILTQDNEDTSDLEWKCLEYLAEISTKHRKMDDVDTIVNKMEELNLSNSKPEILDKCKEALALERGRVALADGRNSDAHKLLIESVEFGNITGAKILLGEVKEMDRGNRIFYISCAHIDICTDRSQDNNNELRADLESVLSDDTSTVGIALKDLRDTQYRMERNILQKSSQVATLTKDVIHKCRTILNETMVTFKNRHYSNKKTSCDYQNLYDCPSEDVEANLK
ncbi:uncharacterized protein [Antedon mediterranea]